MDDRGWCQRKPRKLVFNGKKRIYTRIQHDYLLKTILWLISTVTLLRVLFFRSKPFNGHLLLSPFSQQLSSVMHVWSIQFNQFNIYQFYCQSLWQSLQSQEILNRPVFVLNILNRVWTFWTLLKILNRFWTLFKILNRFWTLLIILNRFWTLLKILNRFWTLLKILNRFWTLLKILNRFWTLLKILNRFWKFWTDSEHYWKFWKDSEHYWKFWTLSFFLNQYILLHFH